MHHKQCVSLCYLQPMWQPVMVREGNEPDAFWNALGGKSEYSREKEIKTYTEDPQLFVCGFTKGEPHIFAFGYSLLKDNVFPLFIISADLNYFKIMSNGGFWLFLQHGWTFPTR